MRTGVMRLWWGLTGVAFTLLIAACEPVDPGLEATLLPMGQRAGSAGPRGGGVALSPRTSSSADPVFNPQDRSPNTNPRVVTNNVYGPGRSSDAYGRMVYHTPGLIIEQTAVGTGDYRDQYGRSVRCYGAGGGTVCR